MDTSANEKTNQNHAQLEQKIEEFESANKLPTFNCHTHIFNFNYVHDKFIKGMFSIRFVFLSGAFLLIIVLGILLLVQLLFAIWPLSILHIESTVFYSITSATIVLLILFILVRKPSITISIAWLRKYRMLRRLTKFLSKILPGQYDILDRMANFIKHSYDIKSSNVKQQEQIFKELTSYYSLRTKFIVLTMDMDYMINCNATGSDRLEEQLDKIKEIKKMQEYENKMFPFIHTDPRRLDDENSELCVKLEEYITQKGFCGFKIYPALGYFPFDKRLKPVYDLAIEHHLPITTHCSVGPVYYRGNLNTLRTEPYYEGNGVFKHPFTGKRLYGNTPKDFTPHFTHPLNYYCLMAKPEQLAEYWNRDIEKDGNKFTAENVRKYRNLKFCLGHSGGTSEWIRYLKDPWLPGDKISLDDIFDLWTHDVYGREPEGAKTYSWHNIIYDMLVTKDNDRTDNLLFPYLYSDISYNVSEVQMMPLLKVRLETNKTFASRILFGTDFYMVSMEASEREITMKLRSFIGEENFKQIAKLNPLRFLYSDVCNENVLLG